MSSNIQLLNRRRALEAKIMSGIRFSHYGYTWDGSALKQTTLAVACDDFIPTGSEGQSQTYIFTINVGVANVGVAPIQEYNQNKQYTDWRSETYTGNDTQGRRCRKYNSSCYYIKLTINAHTMDDFYLYNVTQGRYVAKGKNIPDDYIPEIQT